MAGTAGTWMGVAVAGMGLASLAYANDVIYVQAVVKPTYSVFHDPNGDTGCKEFAFVHNVVPDFDSVLAPGRMRDLFHLIYQRSGGLNAAETRFGHAWSRDLLHWAVDTAAFAVDTTWWNANHVWSPSIVLQNGRYYMFYTGVDSHDDQRIGYVSTALLDTTNTVWDSLRVMVWQASDTRWAVPDPWIYSGQTQFRDPYVIHDPDHPDRLLMFYEAHDSVSFKANIGGLTVGVAQSDPGSVDVWHDLGYYPKTLPRVIGIRQLEGPHVFSANGTGAAWRLMFSSAGTPPGENGHTTIRFEALAAGESLSDTTASHWTTPIILEQYLNGAPTAFGWSGSEELHVSSGDYLAGFTAWTPGATGIAMTRVNWNGTDFTLGAPTVTAVDEYRSPARGLRMSLAGFRPGARRVTFVIDSPLDLDAKLEVFDASGRRTAMLLDGRLARGHSTVSWELVPGRGARVPSGVYFARLSFAGGVRSVQIPIVR